MINIELIVKYIFQTYVWIYIYIGYNCTVMVIIVTVIALSRGTGGLSELPNECQHTWLINNPASVSVFSAVFQAVRPGFPREPWIIPMLCMGFYRVIPTQSTFTCQWDKQQTVINLCIGIRPIFKLTITKICVYFQEHTTESIGRTFLNLLWFTKASSP